MHFQERQVSKALGYFKSSWANLWSGVVSSNGRLFGHHSYANELFCFFWLLIGWTFHDLVISCLGKPTNRKDPKARQSPVTIPQPIQGIFCLQCPSRMRGNKRLRQKKLLVMSVMTIKQDSTFVTSVYNVFKKGPNVSLLWADACYWWTSRLPLRMPSCRRMAGQPSWLNKLTKKSWPPYTLRLI